MPPVRGERDPDRLRQARPRAERFDARSEPLALPHARMRAGTLRERLSAYPLAACGFGFFAITGWRVSWRASMVAYSRALRALVAGCFAVWMRNSTA